MRGSVAKRLRKLSVDIMLGAPVDLPEADRPKRQRFIYRELKKDYKARSHRNGRR